MGNSNNRRTQRLKGFGGLLICGVVGVGGLVDDNNGFCGADTFHKVLVEPFRKVGGTGAGCVGDGNNPAGMVEGGGNDHVFDEAGGVVVFGSGGVDEGEVGVFGDCVDGFGVEAGVDEVGVG